MALTSEIKAAGRNPRERTFPRLMRSEVSGIVVLMTRKSAGIIVASPTPSYVVGHYSEGWGMDVFADFVGSVTLTDDGVA